MRFTGLLTSSAVGNATVKLMSQFLANSDGKFSVQPIAMEVIVKVMTVTKVSTMSRLVKCWGCIVVAFCCLVGSIFYVFPL